MKHVWFEQVDVKQGMDAYVDVTSMSVAGGFREFLPVSRPRCHVRFVVIPPPGIDPMTLMHKLEEAMDVAIERLLAKPVDGYDASVEL